MQKTCGTKALPSYTAHMKRFLTAVLLFACAAASGFAQASPPADTQVTINGKKISIHYCSPSVRGRKIFGGADALQPDNTIWRAGANDATAMHTDADLDIGGLAVPKGDYTLYVWLDTGKWQLAINKQTGQWGTEYDKNKDLGRVAMTMSKPPALIEKYKMTLSSAGGAKGKLQLEWENMVASVPITVK
jgi:hypothetical protein